MEKKNSNQQQDKSKSADKKQTGAQSNQDKNQSQDKSQTIGKKHDADQDASGRIPDRKKEVDDDPEETKKKVPHMNQKH